MLTDITRVSARQSPPYYFQRHMWTIMVAKKTDCRLIRYTRVWRSCWGDAFTYEDSGPTMMGFFSLALHFSHLGLGFRARPINILFCPSFCIILGLILILFIFICFNFNASWSLFFSISVFSAFNLIFFLYNLILVLSIDVFSSFAFILFVFYYFNSFFFKFWSSFFSLLFFYHFFIFFVLNLVHN